MNTDFSTLYEEHSYFMRCQVPDVMVPYLFEIMMVLHQQKPGCRLTVLAADMRIVIKYLDALQLNYYILFKKRTTDSYLQYAISTRDKLIQTERVYIYVAISRSDAYLIFKTDAIKGNYEEVGRLLGYPSCCIASATASDIVTVDPGSGTKRQRNLCTVAIRCSDRLDYRCNNIIAASNLSQHYPTNIISHYPCNYGCRATIAYADQCLSLIKRLYSWYYPLLEEFLQYDIIYWSDELLDAHNIGEFNAIAVNGGRYDPIKKLLTGIQQCINVSSNYFMQNSIFLDVTEVLFTTTGIIIQGNKTTTTIAHDPNIHLLNWKKQQVIMLT